MTLLKRIIFYSICLCFLTACQTHKARFHTFQVKSPQQFRVVTYNINWGNGAWDMSYPNDTLRVIATLGADVVLLQETTTIWEKLINLKLAHHFRYRRFRHYPNAGGFGILSNYPIKTKRYFKPSVGWHPVWLVDVASPLGALQILHLHLTPSLTKNNDIGLLGYALYTTPKIRLQETKEAYRLLPHTKKTIIAGDFNESDNMSSVRYLEEKGFMDALDYTKLHTWYWRFGLLALRSRLDRVFYSPDLKMARIQILHEGNSDHFPVVVDFEKAK